MLRTLKDLFDSLLPPQPATPPAAAEHTLQLATAVLLVEVLRSDAQVTPEERRAVVAALHDKFALADDEAARLMDLAEATARDATDYFAFTSRINEGFEMAQKVRIVEHLWRVAFADGVLSAHEKHALWRIADLLHVPHGANMHAKARAREAAGLAAPGTASDG